MRIAGQVGPGLPTRNGQLQLKTMCGRCKATFSTPTKAYQHDRKQHEPVVLKPSGKNPIWRIRWSKGGTVGAVVSGPNPPNNGT